MGHFLLSVMGSSLDNPPFREPRAACTHKWEDGGVGGPGGLPAAGQ